MTSSSASSATSTGSDGAPGAPADPSAGGILAEGTNRTLVRIVLFYALGFGGVALLVGLFPALREAFMAGRLGEITAEGRQITGGAPVDASPLLGHPFQSGWLSMAVAALSMLGALAIMVPVVWSYIVIKRRGGYDQSIVHTLLILPVAVAGIVMIVKGSLALAFSLAGIVAAVRFRTTLEDTKDAVYVFLAIGVGLASGVQMLGVAAILSILFNAVNLVLWRTNFGNIYADQRARTAPLALGDILAGPASAETAVAIGDRALLTALAPADLREAVTQVARLERYLEAEEEKPKERKKYGILMVHAESVGEAQEPLEREIERHAVRWRLAEILPGRNGVQVLEYLVRLREDVPAGALVDAVRRAGSGHVRAAEFRSLGGLKKKP